MKPTSNILKKIMPLVSTTNNNRWIYTMHGLEKPIDNVSAGGVMAGSVATLAVLWVFLQTMGFFGPHNAIGAFKLPFTLENYLSSSSKDLPSWESEHSLVMNTGSFGHRRVPPIDDESLNASIKFASGVLARQERVEMNLVASEMAPEKHTPAHSQYMHHYAHDEAMDKALDALIAIGAATQLAQTYCAKYNLNSKDCARYLSTLRLDSTPLGDSCSPDHDFDCNLKSKYRSIDGTCNNLQNPKWGSSFTAYGRLLFPEYDDGLQMPRKLRGIHALPNPRTLSVTLNNQLDKVDVFRTLVLMQWSEFVSHDISFTPARKMIWTGKPISCCANNGQWPLPRYIHPDCSAISVPENDPDYGQHNIRCMNYVRSLPAIKTDCTFGPAEQMNQVSHFLDGSTIYGSTNAKASLIRKFEGGLLKTNLKNDQEYLPVALSKPAALCRSKTCYLSGDDRANAVPQLAVMHTLWVREHNRLARRLAEINPFWSDETLYQEARRIVIAEIQHITYKEWLPQLIGNDFAESMGFSTPANYSQISYDAYTNPSINNEVATAVLRFFQSLKESNLSMTNDARVTNESLRLSDYFYKPRSIEENDIFDGLVRGLSVQSAKKMDLHLVPDITNQLYKTDGAVGLDQISLDIQRGRDHGLPGYNQYRKLCGLKLAKKFEDFLDYVPFEVIKKWKDLYKNPNDVDLLIGGMAERSAENGMLGPTFRCLISSQFQKTRETDRYFYDSAERPQRFTLKQLNSIRKVTLARIFCDNGNEITKMQPNVFTKPQHGNELRPCTDFEAIPSIDLFAWAEKAKAYR